MHVPTNKQLIRENDQGDAHFLINLFQLNYPLHSLIITLQTNALIVCHLF